MIHIANRLPCEFSSGLLYIAGQKGRVGTLTLSRCGL